MMNKIYIVVGRSSEYKDFNIAAFQSLEKAEAFRLQKEMEQIKALAENRVLYNKIYYGIEELEILG